MAGQKLTEKQQTAVIKETANFLITQPEGEAGSEVESVRRVQINALIAALRGFGLLSGYSTTEQIEAAMQEYVNAVEAVEGGIKVTYGEGSEVTIPVAAEGGADLSKLHWNWDVSTGYLHMLDENDVDVIDPVWIGGGGSSSGGGSQLTFSVYTDPTFSVIESTREATIAYKYASIDKETGIPTGSGNLAVYVGGAMKTNVTIAQGDHQTVNVFDYLATGTNRVRLTITDSYGNTATRTFTITLESFSVEWSLSDTNIINGDSANFYITPTGNGSKSIYTKLDGVIVANDSVTTSGRRLTKTITGLTHGAHTIEVYGTVVVNGVTLESNHLKAAVAVVLAGREECVIAVKWPDGPLTQYTGVNIPYVVVDPTANPATIRLMEDGETLSEIDVDQSEHIWAYRPLTAGYKLAKIVRGSVTASHQYAVQGLDVDAEETLDGLVCKVDPSTISDLRTFESGGYSFALSENFDTVNGGIIVDENGVHCIRITAGDSMTLNLDPFAENAITNGVELKFVYKIANSSSKTASGIQSMQGGRGIDLQANNVYLYGNQSSAVLPVCEGEKTELDINIQQKTDGGDRLMMIWEKCSSFAFGQYAVDENFRHSENVGITFGCADADVYLYLFRAYGRDLTNAEMRANYIVDGADGNDIFERNRRNAIYDSNGVNFELAAQANPELDCVLISAEKMSTAKKKNGGSVPCTIRHLRLSGGAQQAWTANGSMDLQGTSSEEHALTAGPNLNWRFAGGITLDDGTAQPEGWAMHGSAESIPVNLFNYKKNIASQDHIVNRVCAEWYNRYQPAVRQARADDPRVRDCLESAMCAVFFHNTGSAAVTVGPDLVQPGETIFFGLGNICSSKDCYDTFQYDDIVLEVKQNPSDVARFKSKDLSGNNWSDNYEFRYLNEDRYTEEQAIALWQEVQSFVCDTDWTAATGDALASPVTIGMTQYLQDSAEYRKAKWIAEAADHFEMDTLYWHHIVTLFFLLRDNRAKNMFWSYNSDIQKWALRYNWDNDTGFCRNNQGYVDMEPGYMDWDSLGTDMVFNAADNALFTSLRENNFQQLRQMYVNREAAGAWDIDTIYRFICESQERVCESLWIEDAEHNAIRILENMGNVSYLERATGRLQLHMKKVLTFQKALVDSYFTAMAATTDRARIRANTPTTWAGVEPSGLLTLTTYTDMFVNILAGATAYRQRAYAGVPITIDVQAQLQNTEMYLYSAEWIQELGDMSALYVQQFEIDTMKRVRRVILGSAEGGYYNTALPSISLANCVKLEELNIAGSTNLNMSLNLHNNLYLKKFDSRNSGITGVRFAKNGRLQEARMNALASLYLSSLWNLSEFTVANYLNLGTLTIENCSNVDALAIVNAAQNIENLRLIGISWRLDSTELLNRLLTIGGINDNGVTGDPPAVLTGSVYVPILRQSESEGYARAWPGLTVTYGRFVTQHAVTFKNWDGTTLFVEHIDQGSDAYDPVQSGDIETPERTSTDEFSYAYRGWDQSLNTISGPRTLTAQYTETKRTYTVRWLCYGTELYRATVEYGAEAVYGGSKPTYTIEETVLVYNQFKGWDQSTGRVTRNMSVNAVFERADMSLPISATEDMTATQVYGLKQAGQTALRNALQIKDRVNITLGYQPEFTNVNYWEAAPELTFDGTNYVDTGIDLLKDGIAGPWTLVVDFEFSDNTANNTLMSLWQDDGYMGFKLKYANNGPVMQWGANSYQSAMGTYREIMVIRHQSGSQMVFVYSSNTLNNTIGLTPILKTIDTITPHTLIFGCDQNDAGEMVNYGKGIIHSCRIWYDDLGNTECQKLVSWPREQLTFEVGGYGKYQYAEDTTKYTDVDFISAGLLNRTHRMKNVNDNTGGYDETEMYQWMEARVYNAFPEPWKSLIHEVNVPYVIRVQEGEESAHGEIETAPAHIFLPAYAEVYHTDQEPWIYEGDWITFFTANADRIKFRGRVRAENQQIFTQNTDPCLLTQNNVQDGDLWIDTGSSSIGRLRVNGEWVSAIYFWLRGASVTNANYFCNVYGTGGANTNGNTATNVIGVDPRFSI